jgi:hypothetical protein
MFPKNPKEVSFYGVGVVIILIGAVIFAYGGVTWLFNVFRDTNFSMPSGKIIGGLVVIALGYIQIELELMRRG